MVPWASFPAQNGQDKGQSPVANGQEETTGSQQMLFVLLFLCRALPLWCLSSHRNIHDDHARHLPGGLHALGAL